ncbi:PREDICTED: A disintegrin and metalloproteinase with thrombospondin motifs 13-like [Thamnophis sirtalis]|uniref:A disintegrin and metalloproteinase with thrombospondin motifs 13-like n=1 Tax=Thamnophis sirtalis TaxID=35019 RepID=A0A6I9Z1C0_9SAUR|nr:PREDICTED: A disintegrin and metalloproteinase with thrombospondin motifs 13-like [Thamnophis sirtalis]
MRKVLYCARGTGEEEEVLPDAACEDSLRPEEQEACHLESCPPSWKVGERGPCSSSCGVGVATQSVACVRLSGGRKVEVAEGHCPEAEKPLSVVPCILRVCPYEWGFTPWTQCSVSCGTGIQRRRDFCVNPQTKTRVNPLLCMHAPKPMMVRTCSTTPCLEQTTMKTNLGADVPTPTRLPGAEALTTPEATHPLKGRQDQAFDLPWSKGEDLEKKETKADLSEEPSYVALLVIKRALIRGRICPLRKQDWVWWENPAKSGLQKGKRSLLVVKSKADIDLIVTGGRQLFGPQGLILNPGPSLDGERQMACRIFIDVAPHLRIAIHAMYVEFQTTANETHSSYISIRDIESLRTTVFHGNRLFYWESVGSRAEIEFNRALANVSFRAEYWATK